MLPEFKSRDICYVKDCMRTYTELIAIPDFQARFEYLKLDGEVGQDTFGFDRYLNQQFYRSKRWLAVRDAVIIRDNGCDLAHPDYQIGGKVLIHHLNPITKEDILHDSGLIIDPEFLVCVSQRTHNAIHYGDARLIQTPLTERSKYDTCPWRKDI